MEKNSKWADIGKLLSKANLVAGEKGFKEGLKVLQRYAEPTHHLSKNFAGKTLKDVTYLKDVTGPQKFVAKELGNTSDAILRLTENVGKDKSLVKNVGNVIKNFGKVNVQQMRGAMYKTVPRKGAVLTDSGKLQGQGLFKGKMFDRPIKAKTTSGDYVVRKRKATVPLSLAVTPVGFGAMVAASGDKKESVPKKVSKGIGETAMWSLAPPVALTKLVTDIVK